MDLGFFNKSKTTLKVMGVLSVIGISLFLFLGTPKTKLPVFNPVDVNPKLVDQSMKFMRRNHKVSDFSLMNQNGQVITQANYQGKIYVADFFFTRCTTICPIMSTNMKMVQDAFLEDDTVMMISHSVTPVMDSVPVLRAYADQKGVVDSKWNLVTGSKPAIYDLARKSYFAVLDEGDGGVQDFIHTENFVLVDPKKRIRGYYDGTDKDDVSRLIEDIKILQKEFSTD
ncbi:SCO family protein [Flavobacteriaceae bacterium]|nr:SCO family protein [Flavobacteriaceae bacterium]